jgi:hypothetical protein
LYIKHGIRDLTYAPTPLFQALISRYIWPVRIQTSATARSIESWFGEDAMPDPTPLVISGTHEKTGEELVPARQMNKLLQEESPN